MNLILLKRIWVKLLKMVNWPCSTLKAFLWLKDIVEHKTSNDLYLVLLPGLGDTIFALSYYSSLKKQYKDRDIIIISDDKNVDFVNQYGIGKIISYNNSRKAILEFHSNYLLCRIAQRYGVINTNPYLYYKKNEISNALGILKDKIYQLDDADIQLDFPLVVKDKSEKVSGKRYVIVNPYSASLSQNRWSLFADIVAYLKRADYKVFTNIVGKQRPIDGSEELRCNIYEFFLIASGAAAVISLRSGILDLAVHTGVPMFVLYENCTKKFEAIYKLEQWEQGSNIVEMHTDGISDHQIFNKIKVWIKELD